MRYFLDQIARCEFEHVTSVTSHVFDLTTCNWVEWYSTCWQFSKMGTMLLIKHIFMSPIPFSKNHRVLKYEYYFRKFANTFILLQRTIGQKKICNLVWFSIFLDPQNGQNCFCPWLRQKQYFSFSSDFAFTQSKVHLLKMLFKKFC